jgi:CYTH domain-containing protein
MPTNAAARDREIERKYLLKGLPEAVAGAPSLEFDQGYIPGIRINERIRRARGADDVKYYRTMKTGSGIDRFEIEEETTQEFFEAVWPLTRGARVWKRRYLVPDRDVIWEIDEFLDRDGMWLAEVELERIDQEVVIPDWLAPVLVREVTTEKGYTNRALAK